MEDGDVVPDVVGGDHVEEGIVVHSPLGDDLGLRRRARRAHERERAVPRALEEADAARSVVGGDQVGEAVAIEVARDHRPRSTRHGDRRRRGERPVSIPEEDADRVAVEVRRRQVQGGVGIEVPSREALGPVAGRVLHVGVKAAVAIVEEDRDRLRAPGRLAGVRVAGRNVQRPIRIQVVDHQIFGYRAEEVGLEAVGSEGLGAERARAADEDDGDEQALAAGQVGRSVHVSLRSPLGQDRWDLLVQDRWDLLVQDRWDLLVQDRWDLIVQARSDLLVSCPVETRRPPASIATLNSVKSSVHTLYGAGNPLQCDGGLLATPAASAGGELSRLPCPSRR